MPEEIKVIKELYKENMPALAYVRVLHGRSWGSIRKKITELKKIGELHTKDIFPGIEMKELQMKLEPIFKRRGNGVSKG